MMYRQILVAIENSKADRTILDHVERLARLTGARLLLVHVADGWVARNFKELQLRESEEMRQDRQYLQNVCDELVALGFDARARLAMGDPAAELVKVAEEEGVDLIAMATHGHKFLNDLLRGTTADRVRHNARVPVLMVRAAGSRMLNVEP